MKRLLSGSGEKAKIGVRTLLVATALSEPLTRAIHLGSNMSNGTVSRPQGPKKRIDSRDEFELCYLRHKYVRKTSYNPTATDMEPFMGVIRNLSKNTFYTYQSLMNTVGLDLDDIINIGRVHLTSYLGLFSIRLDKARFAKFEDTFYDQKGYPARESDILGKERADLTSFIKQRYEDLVRVCRQKARNIKGHVIEEYFTYRGPTPPPPIVRDLIDNYQRYGFKKIDQATFRSIRKKAKPHGNVFFFDGLWYAAVSADHKNLGIEDFTGAGLSPYDNVHNMTPEEILFQKAQINDFDDLKEEFESYTRDMKINMVTSFIKKNTDNRHAATEVALARKLLKSLEI